VVKEIALELQASIALNPMAYRSLRDPLQDACTIWQSGTACGFIGDQIPRYTARHTSSVPHSSGVTTYFGRVNWCRSFGGN
jgi:hypothetical protein